MTTRNIGRRLAFYRIATEQHPLTRLSTTTAVATPGLGAPAGLSSDASSRSSSESGRTPASACQHAPSSVQVIGLEGVDRVLPGTNRIPHLFHIVDLVPAETISCIAGHRHVTAVRPSHWWETGNKSDRPDVSGAVASPTPEMEGSAHASA